MGRGETAPETFDAFHRGRFWLAQPSGRGHRAGMDAMVLAAAVPDGFDGHVADLGAGAGAAGFAVISRCPLARVTLVERDDEMAGFARRSIAHESNAGLSDRIDLLQADVALSGKERQEAGLVDRSFDFVIMNPPFNAGSDRASDDPLKRAAHVGEAGLWDRWIRTAAAILRPDGRVALIARPEQTGEILAALAGRFGAVAVKPVFARMNSDAIRIVLRARKGSRAPLSIAPPLVLHPGEGNAFGDEADAVINGRRALFARGRAGDQNCA